MSIHAVCGVTLADRNADLDGDNTNELDAAAGLEGTVGRTDEFDDPPGVTAPLGTSLLLAVPS